MSRILRFCLLAAAMAALLALPSGALAADHDGDAPKRVSAPADRALRALERAEGKIEDGDSGAAALKSVRRGLSKSLKAATKRLGSDSGPDSAYVVAETQGEVASGVADL